MGADQVSTETNTITKWFDSPEAYLEYLRDMPSALYQPNAGSWGGGDWDQVINKLITGDTTCLAQAQKIIDQMQDQQIFSTSMLALKNDVVGFIPNVGNALMGVPDDMYNIAYNEDESITSPIRIFVETTVSAGVGHKELVNRGVAILAFVLAMNVIRPIEIYAVSAGRASKNTIIVTKIISAPMDLARATWMLTSEGYARMIAFAAMCKACDQDHYSYIGWNWNSSPTEKDYITKMRLELDCQPTDILMAGGYLFDKLMLNDPIAWVKQMIEKHNFNQSLAA